MTSLFLTDGHYDAQETPSLLDALGEALLTFGTLIAVRALIYLGKCHFTGENLQSKTPAKAKMLAKTQRSSDGAPVISSRSPSAKEQRKSSLPAGFKLPSGKNVEWSDGLLSLIRAGKAAALPEVLDRARDAALSAGLSLHSRVLEEREAQYLASALRGCASYQLFREALLAYDHMADRIGKGDRVIWSVLLYCAVQASELHRCKLFFQRLCAFGSPSGKDVVNMVRIHALRRDAAGLSKLLSELRSMGCKISAFDRNRALSGCTYSGALDLAEIMSGPEAAKICAEKMDIVGFNIIMKAYAVAGYTSACFAVLDRMRCSGLNPSVTTLGILIDACVDAKEYALAKYAFEQIQSCGLKPNVVHFTTLMKGFMCAGELEEATAFLEEMMKSQSAQPDLIAFSMLIRAHSERGSVEGAIYILEKMLSSDLKPYETTFNMILGGCAVKRMEATKLWDVLAKLIRCGLEPSNTTLSHLIKALVVTTSFDAAIDLLRRAWRDLGVKPEARIYAQLAQGCIAVNCGEKAVEVYELLTRAALQREISVDGNTNLRLYRHCCSCGHEESALTLFQTLSTLYSFNS
eukprot:CAMPEP_0170619988 /NCGR_PEP_ID=MMETSP0224-20130122/27816_1 /TAXON_ID=285029 /ORGANISM="Togula jolla, Strain CCCM 725" /LENGTH=576 /DNA_ID=CAMNT_0010946127 /DNA_START=77 /DNA_END=1807 /DNA_ORIENTATION=-